MATIYRCSLVVALTLGVVSCHSCAKPTPGSSFDASVDVSAPAPDADVPEASPDAGSDGCAEFANAFCTREETCAKLTFRLDHADHASCVLELKAGCDLEAAAAGSGFNASACAAGIAKRACGLWNDLTDMDIAACHPKGKLPIGAKCDFDSQCESGLSLGDGKGVSHCVDDANESGDAMMQSFNDGTPTAACPHGMIRARTTCLRISYPGQSCQISAAPYDPCLGSFCEHTNELGKGICTRDTGCGTEVDVPKCGSWQTCNEATERCENVILVPDNGLCDNARKRCNGGARCKAGKCARLGRLGDACGSGECLPPTTCIGGQCVLP